MEKLRSSRFNFSLKNPIGREMFAIEDYDGTVNIMFTDGVNELRTVNSAFDQEGNVKFDRMIQEENFDESIKLIKNLPTNQNIEYVREGISGKLKFGNYIFFYRYLTQSNDPTVFVSESYPVAVVKDLPNNKWYKTSGFDTESTMGLRLKLSNLDQKYAYVQLAYVRHYQSEAGTPISQVMLIDNLRSITSPEMNIDVTGYETHIPIDISEIMKPVNREDTVKSIINYDRRIWGANWKAKEINTKALSEHAKRIRMFADDTFEIPSWAIRSYYGTTRYVSRAGYFRGETYIAGVVYVLKNGFETERFPTKGIDAYNINPKDILSSYNSGKTNENGIIRIPGNHVSPYIKNSENGIVGSIMRLGFNLDEAKAFLNSGTEEAEWIKENVAEIKFVRAERVPNLITQGIIKPVGGRGLPDGTGVSIPLLQKNHWSPTYDLPAVRSGQGSRYFNTRTVEQNDEELKTASIFSTDFIFKSDNDLENISIAKEILEISEKRKEDANISPSTVYSQSNEIINNDSRDIKVIQQNSVKSQNNWITPRTRTSLNLINKSNDYFDNKDREESIFYQPGDTERFNRSIIFAPYIGIKSDINIRDYFDRPELKTVNLYRENPDEIQDITRIYENELNLNYYSVTTVKININSSSSNVRCFQGDSFIQKTTIKAISWESSKVTSNERNEEGDRVQVGVSVSAHGYGFPSGNNRKYAHGLLIDIITENSINTALRIENENETTFFPATPKYNINSDSWTGTLGDSYWAVFPFSPEVTWENKRIGTGIESYLINKANSKTLSIKPYLSFNPFIPKGKDLYPNRIRYTGQQEPNFPILSYRIWDYNAKQDYDPKDGHIKVLRLVFGKLVTIQDNSILMHNTHTEESVPSTSGEMIIGVRSILSARASTLSRFGTKHPLSVIYARTGLYGWDWDNSVIWRISINDDGYLMARSISKEYQIEKHIEDLHNLRNLPYGKKLKDEIIVADNNIQEGIFSYYNSSTNEILFYSAFGTNTQILRFSENINGFLGVFTFKPKYMFELNNSMLSIGHGKGNQVWVHDKEDYSFFYNEEHDPVFSFVVNGIMGEMNLFYIDKLFKSIEIESPRHEGEPAIQKIEFKSTFQETENNPFYDPERFWLLPEYLMSKWASTINEAQLGEEQFYENSNVNGKWMKVTVTLKPRIDTFVKNIITKFITSKA